MTETTYYVTYFISQHKAGQPAELNDANVRPLFPITDKDALFETQKQAVNDYLEPRKHTSEIVGSFTETPENRRTSKWPQLLKAIEACKQRHATLIIAELGTLTSNEAFSHLLIQSGVTFHCCDQPFVNQTILEALHKHAQVQRKLHGKLIREGLKMTSAKSGNPNAAEVISKVNKPKIDTAIVFAFLLQPIITDYRRKGYSQRQMVKTLNEEGFTAPEGGKWVLSQLQKVLDRVRLNEVSTEVETLLTEFESRSLTLAQIAQELNERGIAPLKRNAWDENQTKKLLDRVNQIKDIELINRFVLHLLPVIHEYRRRGLTETQMITALDQAGIGIRKTDNEAQVA